MDYEPGVLPPGAKKSEKRHLFFQGSTFLDFKRITSRGQSSGGKKFLKMTPSFPGVQFLGFLGDYQVAGWLAGWPGWLAGLAGSPGAEAPRPVEGNSPHSGGTLQHP